MISTTVLPLTGIGASSTLARFTYAVRAETITPRSYERSMAKLCQKNKNQPRHPIEMVSATHLVTESANLPIKVTQLGQHPFGRQDREAHARPHHDALS